MTTPERRRKRPFLWPSWKGDAALVAAMLFYIIAMLMGPRVAPAEETSRPRIEAAGGAGDGAGPEGPVPLG